MHVLFQERKQREVEERLIKEKQEENNRRKTERQDLLVQRRDAQDTIRTLTRKKAYVQIVSCWLHC
jgi:hypothetical protein